MKIFEDGELSPMQLHKGKIILTKHVNKFVKPTYEIFSSYVINGVRGPTPTLGRNTPVPIGRFQHHQSLAST